MGDFTGIREVTAGSRPAVHTAGTRLPTAPLADSTQIHAVTTVPNDTETTFRPLGAILGWVFPGLGHIASGNVRRGIYAMTGVLVLFLGGIAVGGVDCVDRTEDRLWFIGQAGCGPIAFAADYANTAFLKSGDAAPMIKMPTPPGAPEVAVSSFKGLAHANEFGTLFVFLAGLLNICVLLDAAVRAPASDGVQSGRRSGEGAPR